MFSPDFINKKTKRANGFRTAKKNGLFSNPQDFTFPSGIGLDLLNQRAVSINNLRKKLNKGLVGPDQVYIPGAVVLPETKKLVKATTKNKELAQRQTNKLKMNLVLSQLSGKKGNSLTADEVEIKQTMKNFKNVAVEWKLTTNKDFKDIIVYREAMKRVVVDMLVDYIRNNGPFKVIFKLGALFVKDAEEAKMSLGELMEKDITPVPHVFSSGGAYQKTDGEEIDTAVPALSDIDVIAKYRSMFDQISKRIEEYEENGSGWVFHSVEFLKIRVVKYSPLQGASYIDLPLWLKNKQCCINVLNKDNRCFEYAVLSALHNKSVKEPKRVTSYKPYLNKLNFDGIEFPVASSTAVLERFEKQNGIAINVFSVSTDQEERPDQYSIDYVSRLDNDQDPINLLLVYGEDRSHYVWIKNLNGFIKDSSDALHCCPRCLHRFHTERAFKNHKVKGKCDDFKSEILKVLPEHGKHFCSFNNTKKQMMVPFVLYADCESMLIPTAGTKGENTSVYQTHKVSHIGAKLVSRYPDFLEDSYQQFEGEDCMDKFLAYCMSTYDKALAVARRNVKMIITPEESKAFAAAQNCNLCGKHLGNDRVRDHDHITGKYRGACHSNCNINFNYRDFKLPVIFHNLKNYDAHLILQYAGKLGKEISCIPHSMEKYLSFSVGKCVFLDSQQFMNASLEELVKNLNKAGDGDLFSTFNKEFKEFSSDVKALLRQKGLFPYDWYDSALKLKHNGLPDKAAFYSKLNEEHITDKDFALAQLVWLKTGCKTFSDYLFLYLKADVVLLADVFEAFRAMCMRHYGLDACHYFTAPGFSWDAMLKMTGVTIECFKEGQLDMLQMVQKGMRGGISVVSHRFAKANNKYLSTYNPSQPSSYLMYLDANNLYGWAMSQHLPIGNYKWEDAQSFSASSIMGLSDTSSRGFIFEVDLTVPTELHDYFNDYPLAPETTNFDDSPAMKALREKLEMSQGKVNKLVPNLNNKTKYVLHYRSLKLYLQLGLKLDRIHRVLSFRQTPYLKRYIDFNTAQRAAATTDFERNFFKLLNNAIFGKTCENVDKRIDVKLMTNANKFVTAASRPYFKNFEIFNEDLVACELKRTRVVYNRPMIVGMCVLDISKVLMYDFHYNTIKAKYGDRATLCFTDTDSFAYHIKTEDVYADMKESIGTYDTSDFPSTHPCFSNVNKKVPGKFKDQMNGKPLLEFVGLRAKMYSLLEDQGASKATAKGIKRNVIKTLTHEQYKAAIFGTAKEELQQKVSFNLIRSDNHKVTSVRVTKTGLCCYDDKRWVLDDGISTLAHGHCKARE